MDIKNLDLNLMIVFEAVFHENNLSRAGQKIGLSQPAMSAALSRLRNVYDDILFVRTRGGLTPTEKAKELAPPILQALSLISATLSKDKEFRPEKCERTFRLAMSDWVEIALLPKLSSQLRKKAPSASLLIFNDLPGEMQNALDEDRIDLAITGLPRFGEGAYKQKLFHERYQCIVWRKHPEIHRKLTLENYVRYPHVLYSPEGKGPGAADKALAKKKLKRMIAMRVPISSVIPPIIRGSDMISTLPEKLCRSFAEMTDLRVFDPPLELPGHDIVQYWHKKYHKDNAHQWFRNLLIETCKKPRDT